MKVRNVLLNSLKLSLLASAMSSGSALALQATGFANQNGGTTGGAGGSVVYASTGTEIHQALCSRAADDTPIIIYVEGTINHGNTNKVSGDSCNTADGVIEIKEVSNVSIIGTGNGALFDELGIHIRKSSNIILQNLHVRNVKKSGSPTSNGGDAIGMESNVSNVWVDHVTLEAQGGESDGYDALFDMKADTTYVTLSYSILRNSGRGGLVGSSSSDNSNGPVTFHHNIYENIDSRVPLFRGRIGHTYNNHFNGINKSGINSRVGGKVMVERNYFENAKDPLGTFYTNDIGYWEVHDNIFTSSVVWTADDDKNHPAGPNVESTTSVSIPYSYSMDDASCIPEILAATSGANTGLAVSSGTQDCAVTDGGGDTGGGDTGGGDTDGGDTGGGDTGGEVDSSGENYSLTAGSDGSSKGAGSYGSVRDGDVTSYWSPSGSTGRISIKGLTQPINAVRIIEASGSEGTIGAWRLVDNDSGEVLSSGNGIDGGYITFTDTSVAKINFVIESASGTPKVAEFETYSAVLGDTGGGETDNGSVSATTSVSGSDVTISWSNDNITVTGQEIYRDTDADLNGRVRIVAGVIGNSFTDSDVADGNYFYSVKITGDNGTHYNSAAIAANVTTSTPVSEVFEENANGFCLVDGAVESDHSGYTATGYANTDNELGKGVTYAISVTNSGTYSLSSRYANGSTDRPAAIIVNDTLSGNLSFTGTGAWGAYTSTGEITVTLSAGLNFIRLQATGDSGLANIDNLTVTGIDPEAGNCNGQVGDGDTSGGDTGGGDTGGGGSEIVYPNADCAELINNDSINWRESSLQTDQEIVQCLSESLGSAVGYGENATGGYNPNGGSNLVIITNNQAEDQILTAISSSDHNWIVFDKNDFANETPLMMYRPYCADTSLQSALGVNEATCRDPYAWCSANGVSSSDCLLTFFNEELNDKSLPIRNYLVDSNTTIDGRGAKATFTFNGFKIGADSSGQSTHQSDNVIITNNKFVGVGHTEDHNLDPDMIRSTGESYDIWIHQNTFDTTGDSAFDVKVGAHDITVSFNKLVNVKRAALHGSSDSREINSQITTTIHNNLFVTTDDNFGASSYNTMRRVPLLRRGQTHMFNNVFYGYRKDVMSLRKGARALLEDNLFMNPVDNSKGDDLSDWAEVLFDDAVTEGSLEITGSYVYESGSNCTPSGASASLDVIEGSVPNMHNDYNSASQSTINNNQLSVGDDLRNYVMASAGKAAKTPYVSSYSAGESSVISAAPSSCQ